MTNEEYLAKHILINADRKKILAAERNMLNDIRDDFYVELQKFNQKRKNSFIERKDTIYQSFDFCMGTELTFDLIFSRLQEHDKNLFKREQEYRQEQELEIMMKGTPNVE